MSSFCCIKPDKKEYDIRSYRVLKIVTPRPILLSLCQPQHISSAQFTLLAMKPALMRTAPKKGEVLSPCLLTPPIPPRNPARIPDPHKRMSYFDISFIIKEPPSVTYDRKETMEQGLGINFYGRDGEEGGKSEVNEAAAEAGILATSTPSPFTSSGLEAQPQSVGTPNHVELQTPNFNYEPFITPDDPPLSLIDQLLEENYRGQAESFVRIASQASVRSLSLTQTSSGSSVTSSIRPRPINRTTSSVYTPTRKQSKGKNLDWNLLLETNRNLRTPSGADRVILEPYSSRSGSRRKHRSGFTPEAAPPHTTYGHKVFTVPRIPANRPHIRKRSERSSAQVRGPFYFTDQERQAIAALVHANPRNCDRHANCTDCHNVEYAYYENKTMPTSMPPEERQKIINNNRSLRNIKNELENLAESGAISDAAYDTIMQALPAESSLNGPAPSRSAATSPTQAPVPSASFSNLSVSDPPPPAYNNPTPPSLPGRTPSKPEIARATALYRYAEAGDCNFEVGDQISVHEYMNADWWLGKNMRTGQEGVFPVNYVQVQTNPSNTSPQNYLGNEKVGGYGGYQPQQQQGPPPPGPSNPYNSAVPPMQIAEQPVESKPGKGQEMGKKFGKKLGNAAIFGAGATIGGNIVNSIF